MAKKSSRKMVCYLGSWSLYRNGNNKFPINELAHLCTHVIYAFAKLDGNQIVPHDNWLDIELNGYQMITDLRTRNPKLKTLIAIGGWKAGSGNFSAMASNSDSRLEFIGSVLLFLGKHRFDGIDLDWEYPAHRDGNSTYDKANFVLLCQELRLALTGKLLTAAVSPVDWITETAYDIKPLVKCLDFVNLMTYDLHGSWDKVAYHPAPLFSHPDDSDLNRKLTVDKTTQNWLISGVDSSKLVLGIPLYGKTYTLTNSSNTGPLAPINGPGQPGWLTKSAGTLTYSEICSNITTNNTFREPNWQVPYSTRDDQWIGFEDSQSVAKKVEYLTSLKLGGAMVWSVDSDDYGGMCGHGLFPLLTAINEKLFGKCD